MRPDLTTLGKIIGGGMPIGAYGGRRDIMEMVSPLGPVYQAGTLSGNPVATAAGIATLTQLQEHPEIYEELDRKGALLADAMRKAFGRAVSVNQIGSLIGLFFMEREATDQESVLMADTGRYADYFSYMLDHGIYLAPSQFEAMFVSAAHSREDLAKTCQALDGYARSLR